MIHTLAPYPEYKSVSIPWLQFIPKHWEVARTKHLFLERVETGYPDKPLLAATQTHGVIPKSAYGKRTVVALKNLHLLKLVHVGDFVISLRSFEGGFEIAHTRGIISPAYTILIPRQAVFRGYYKYLFKSAPFIDSLTLFITGIREGQNIDYARFSRAYLPLPPFEEQQTIARFLEHFDRRINRFIRSKQRLIQLLNEQKQAIIHQAVTQGLDPTVPHKDSGGFCVETVPEHWVIMPIKRAFISMAYGISESATDAGTIRLLTMGHIRDGAITVPGSGGVASVDSSLLLQAGDLLFNRTNSKELVGKVGLFKGHESPVTFASYLVRMRPHPDHLPEYLNAMLNDFKFLALARREAIPSLHQSNLNPTRYGRLPIALPPLAEQVAIMEWLQHETQGISKAASAAQREINLLQEYRLRIISDVVTGKLDVTGLDIPPVVPEDAFDFPDEVITEDLSETEDEVLV